MSKDFEKEYKAMVQSEIPDLWNRIESGLSEKPIKEEIKPLPQREKKRIRYGMWGGIAAACLCLIVAVPVFIRGIGNTAEHMTTSMQAESVMEAYDTAAKAEVTEEAAAGAAQDSVPTEDNSPRQDVTEDTITEVMPESAAESLLVTVEIIEVTKMSDYNEYQAKVLTAGDSDMTAGDNITIRQYDKEQPLLAKAAEYELFLIKAEEEAQQESVLYQLEQIQE